MIIEVYLTFAKRQKKNFADYTFSKNEHNWQYFSNSSNKIMLMLLKYTVFTEPVSVLRNH